MFTSRWMSLTFRVCSLGSAFLLAACVAGAQSSPSQDQSASANYSSSRDGMSQFATLAAPEALAPASSASAAGQYGNGGGYGSGKSSIFHRLTYEASGGFNAPQSDSITYGGQFTVGAGVNLNKYLAMLVEYQFLDAKLPGYLIAEAGADGGHAHIWSFTVAPVLDLFPKAKNDLYITGGGGFYRKVTSFTDPEETEYCDYYYCEEGTENVVVGHFSSNQGGVNIGAGYQRRLGGMYNDSKMRLFVEARYLYVDTPAVTTEPNGLGTTTVASGTKLIPVSFGVRW